MLSQDNAHSIWMTPGVKLFILVIDGCCHIGNTVPSLFVMPMLSNILCFLLFNLIVKYHNADI